MLPDIARSQLVGDGLRREDWNGRATELYSRGDLDGAIQQLVAATKAVPYGAHLWLNLGQVLLVRAMQVDGEAATALLCESVAALELSAALGDGKFPDQRKEALSFLRTGCTGKSSEACFAKRCGALEGTRYAAARRALAPKTTHEQAVDGLCIADEARIRLAPPAWEVARGALSAVSTLIAWALFRTCGVVAIDGLLDVDAIKRVRTATMDVLAKRMPTIDAYRAKLGAGGSRLESEALASRDMTGMRYELKLPHTEPPFNASAVADNELLLSLVKLLLLNSAVALDTYSAVVSLAGCPEGGWHADVEDPFAFHANIVRGSKHPPPPGLVAVVPLINVTAMKGPTAFRLGSHVKRDGGMWSEAYEEEASSWRELSLPVSAGSAVLFDLRVDHRGGANRSPAPRPILYLGFTMRWYRDVSNFAEPHSTSWARLESATHRALYSRLDAEEYVRTLEREVEAKGGDLAALKASAAVHEGVDGGAHALLL